MNVSFRMLAVCIASLLLVSGAARAKDPGVDALAVYAGTWRIHIVHYKTQYSKARSETSVLTNDCWRSRGFYACDQIVDGVSRALIVYTYDAKAGIYRSHVLQPDGSPPSSGTLSIVGNVWTFPWQDKDGTRTVYLRVVNTFVGPNRIAYRQEYSYDNVSWVRTASGGDSRLR